MKTMVLEQAIARLASEQAAAGKEAFVLAGKGAVKTGAEGVFTADWCATHNSDLNAKSLKAFLDHSPDAAVAHNQSTAAHEFNFSGRVC